LAPSSSVTTLGYEASRKTTIDVTNLILKGTSIKSLEPRFQSPRTQMALQCAQRQALASTERCSVRSAGLKFNYQSLDVFPATSFSVTPSFVL
jgi:hypothetical protein